VSSDSRHGGHKLPDLGLKGRNLVEAQNICMDYYNGGCSTRRIKGCPSDDLRESALHGRTTRTAGVCYAGTACRKEWSAAVSTMTRQCAGHEQAKEGEGCESCQCPGKKCTGGARSMCICRLVPSVFLLKTMRKQ
jgi:hypothetical protein